MKPTYKAHAGRLSILLMVVVFAHAVGVVFMYYRPVENLSGKVIESTQEKIVVKSNGMYTFRYVSCEGDGGMTESVSTFLYDVTIHRDSGWPLNWMTVSYRAQSATLWGRQSTQEFDIWVNGAEASKIELHYGLAAANIGCTFMAAMLGLMAFQRIRGYVRGRKQLTMCLHCKYPRCHAMRCPECGNEYEPI